MPFVPVSEVEANWKFGIEAASEGYHVQVLHSKSVGNSLGSADNPHVHFMAWDALFRIPGFSWLIRRLRAFPVQIDSADPRSTREAVRLLQSGQAVMIFPEGGRTPDGRLQRFRPGAFRLACSLKIPVLPVTILGGHEAWPPGRVLPRPGRLTIVYHPVVRPPTDADVRRAARVLADRVREAVASRLPSAVEPPAADHRA